MKRVITLSLISVALGLAGLSSDATAQEAVDKAAVCTGCHGPSGQSVVPDNPILAAQHQEYLADALKAYADGQREHGIMKTMAARLSEQDLASITAYFSSQLPYKSSAPGAGDAASGKDKAAACAGCHGQDGNSMIPLFPSLAGQHADYMAKAIREYKSGVRQANTMPLALIEGLSDADIDDIAAYYSNQSPKATR